MYLALGFSELADNKLYMAQALISPDGEILIHRHKLRPSGGERLSTLTVRCSEPRRLGLGTVGFCPRMLADLYQL